MKINYEKELQKTINKQLRNNNIKYIHLEKGKGLNKTHRKGFPDLAIFPGKGKVFFVELKSIGKVLTNEQKKFMMWTKYNGYILYVISTINEWNIVKSIELN